MAKIKLPVLTRSELMKVISRSYPEIHCETIQKFNAKHYPKNKWIWIGGDSGSNQVFSSYGNARGYEGGINNHFSKWLNTVGWYIEIYDYGTYFLIPLSDISQQTKEDIQRDKEKKAKKKLLDREINNGKVSKFPDIYCPF